MIKLKDVSKYYYNKGLITSGITKINAEFNIGEFIVITGESGSGKSTLLNVISGLDTYEDGEMYIDGKETSHYGDEDFEEYRKEYISNIFQNFNLVGSYTVYQNIELVMLINGYTKKEARPKILKLINEVELTKYKNTRVSKLSGGQKQRVAIARALAKNTPIIIADEPTGNLDKRAAESVLKTLALTAKDKLVIVVTHNYEQVEKYATRKITMFDGKILEDKIISLYNHNVLGEGFSIEETDRYKVADHVITSASLDNLINGRDVNDIEKLQSEDIPILNESTKFLTTGLINPQLIERYKTEVVSYNNRMLLKSLENGALRSYYI